MFMSSCNISSFWLVNMMFFIGYINNAVIKLLMYFNSHVCSVWQIMESFQSDFMYLYRTIIAYYWCHRLCNIFNMVTLFSLHFIPRHRSGSKIYENNVAHVKTTYKLWLPWIISFINTIFEMVVCVLVLYGRYKTVKEQLDMINNVTFDFETIAS
jgi:hypothetical protein